MKRKLLTVFSLLLSLLGVLLIGSACNRGGEEFKPEEHEVIEEYYYDANGSEDLITLYSDDFFTLSIAGEEGEGKYVREDDTLTLKLGKKGGEIVATISDNVLNLTYKEVAYNFRLKVNYTVQFDTKGGTTVDDARVLNGKTVAKPSDPIKDGEAFIGWYTDEAFRNLYEFSRPVTGDMKLYARFVAPIDPEFTVKFDAGEGASAVDPMTTKGGKLYNPELPTPTKSGSEFVGWYVSQFYTADKLSYRYNEQPIAENITLYAVWDDGNPVVSVEETGVDVGVALGDRYTITITAPDGTKPVDGMSSTSAHYTYNFAGAEKGEYTIEVTIGGKTTVRYYNNKALARVSVFEVEESTILFNAVPGATKYLLTVTCGTEGHTHEDIDLGDTRSWFFGNCDMPADGIKFVVKAEADGYVTSVSEAFPVTRSLTAVTKVTVNSETETATWDAVSGATSYFVTVLKGEEEVYAGNIGEATSFDLKYYAEGNYTIKVRPVARGWSSPADTACTYEKTRIATPKGLTYTGSSFTWEAVSGAEKYIVTIDGVPYTSTTTTLSLEGIEFNGAKEAIEVTVRAIKGNDSSIDSDAVTLRATLGNIRYEDGKLSWDAVTGVTQYVITIDGGDPIEVEGTSYDVTFTHAGDYTFTVSSRLEGGTLSVPKELTVEVYEIKFEMDRDGASALPSVFVADNDTIPYPDAPTFHGYTFEHWYTAPGGADGEGKVYDDVTFRDRQTRTLYAGWTANEHTLTFDVGQYGEDLDVDSVKVRFGERTTVDGGNLPVPTTNDPTRAFAGWYLDANHSIQLSDFRGQIVSSGFLQDADVKLYASYVEVFKFDDDAQGGVSVSKGPGITQGIVTEAKIPDQYGGKTVTRIIDFSGSSSLEVLRIPDTIQTIILGSEGNAFAGCTSLRAIEVYEVTGNTNEKRYSSDDGVLIDTYLGDKWLRFYPAARSGDYTIPDGVTRIPLGAFVNVTGLTKLSVSHTVSEIQQGAFKGCMSLQEIEFLSTPGSETVTALDIREGAFESCDAITKIHIPTRLTSITAETFSALTNLEAFTADVGGKYVAIDGLLCTNYEGEGSVSSEYEVVFVPKGKNLGEYTIPAQIVSIGERAFYEHPKLTGIIIPGQVRHIGKEAFGHIVDSANKASLTSITFKGTKEDPDLVIEEKAFYAGYTTTSGSDSGTNTLVTELRLPANLVKLGQFAFGKYTKLLEVWVNTDRTAVEYADYAFAADSSTNLSYVTTAHIGPACPAFSYSGVFGSKLASIDVDEENPYVRSEEDVVYDIKGANILFFPVDKGGDFSIPDGVKAIAPSAFAGRTKLQSISIPASVLEVGENAFNGCTGLLTVTFRAPADGGEGDALAIKARAFYGCTKLSTITLPDRLVSLGSTVFYNCDGLTSIHLPKNLKTIDQIENSSYMGGGYYFDLFYMCDNLAEITVDEENQYFTGIDGVLYVTQEYKLDPAGEPKRVAYEAIFTSPGAPEEIKVPGTVRIVRTYAFRNIYHTASIIFENLVPLYNPEDSTLNDAELTFQQYALYGYNSDTTYGQYNESVKEIVLPNGIKTIGAKLFYEWKGLTSITIPNTVTSIEEQAFYRCDNLGAIDFEEGGTEPLVIGDGHVESYEGSTYYGVFTYVSSYSTVTSYALPLDSIVLPARTKHIGDYAFYYSPVKSITFDGELENELTIGAYAFGSCTKLTGFTIPEGTKEIGRNAFNNATLSEIDLPDSLVTIGDQAFAYTHVTNHKDTLTIPKNVESIGYSAFYDNSGYRNYTTVDLSAATNLTFIGYQAFAYMKTLTTVKFAEATEDSPALKIGASAFFNDPLLNNVVLPANVADIGSETVWGASGTFTGNKSTGQSFANNYALKSITFDTYKSGDKAGKSDLALIADKTFTKTGLTSIKFPESVGEELVLGTNLFTSCASLKTVYLSTSIQNIDGVFSGCGSLQTITVAEGSKFFSESKDPSFPALYNAEGDSVLFVYQAVNGHIDILSGVRIGANAFANQTEITSVTIGTTVQEIGSYAFQNCISLQSVTFQAGSVLTSIGSYAFSNCYELSSINLEACTHLTTLGTNGVGYIFQNCNKLSIDLEINSSDLQNVGTYAFSYCGITGVDLSKCTSLTDLGNYAFGQNDALTSIKFPSSLVFLGQNTFRGSDNITEIDLSNTQVKHLSATRNAVQTAYTGLFIFDCENLETVKLPEGFQSIGLNSFNGATNLKAIYIGKGEANDLSSLSSFQCGALEKCGIPNVKISGSITYSTKGSSTSSYYGTFEGCTNLKSVEFVGGANLKEIPRSMFKGCTSLDTVNFADLTNLATIGQDAFRGCGFTSVDLSKCKGGSTFMSATYTFAECANLTDVTLPDNVTKVGNYAFMGTGFTTLDLGKFSQFTSWGNYMFQNCLGLTQVTIPASVTLTATAGTYLFDGCESLSTVNIDKDYKGALPNYMFRGCTQLSTVNFNGAKVSKFGTYVFKGCTSLRDIDLSSATAAALGNYMFDGCESLTNVTLPEAINHLGTYTFRNCIGLRTIDLSNTKIDRFSTTATGNVTASLAVHTFEGCTNLEKVILPEGGITQIGGQVFLNCTSLTTIENLDLSELTHIGKEAFRNCAYITGTVTLGENLQILGDYAFVECPGVTSFTGADNGKTFKTQNGMIVKVEDGSIVAIPANMSVEGDTLKITGSTLAAYVLQDFHTEGVTKLDLSGLTAESLPDYALTGTSFEEITLPDTITTLGTYMFANSEKLKTVHLPKGLTSLGSYAFQNCVNLTDVNIPEGLTALPGYCFDGCTSFTGFKFPETITETGTYAFRNTGLTEIIIPETVTALGNYTFSGILTLKSATFQGNPSVGTYLFSGCTELANIDLGPCTAISTREFEGTAITDFTFNENLTTIGQYPFTGSKLKSVIIDSPQDAFTYPLSTTMSATLYLFQDCAELADVTINSEFTKLNSYWFKNCVSLETITIPETVTEIGAQCFQGCTKLREINLPENLTTIGNNVFTDCTSLTGYFVLSDNIVSLGTNVFSGCTGLDGIELSTSVGSLSSTSFGGMSAEQTIRFRNSRFEVVASCGVAWISSTADLHVEYNYDPNKG